MWRYRMAGPKWQKANPASLSPSVQNAFEKYAAQFRAATEAGKELKTLADTDWIEKNPDGINGQYVVFNVTNGALQWAWSKKKPKSKKSKSEGVDVPSASPLDEQQETGAQSNQALWEAEENKILKEAHEKGRREVLENLEKKTAAERSRPADVPAEMWDGLSDKLRTDALKAK